MKIWMGLCALFFCSLSFSAPLPLSSTFTIKPQSLDNRWNYLPAMNVWRSENKWNNESFAVTVIYNRPQVFANKVSVQKMWDEQNAHTLSQSKILDQKGCRRQGRVHFVCERMINESNNLLAIERLYWNEKSDLALVRISTGKSREALQQYADKFQVQMSSRLPASVKKGVRK